MDNLLYLTHRLPYPPNRGDRIRTYHLLRFLSQHYRVHLACLADEPPAAESVAHLQELCDRVEIVPHQGLGRWASGAISFALGKTVTQGLFHAPKLNRITQQWCTETSFAAAVASSSGLAESLRVANKNNVPCLMDLIDVDSRKWLDYAAKSRFPKSQLYRQEGLRLRRVETDVSQWTTGLTVVSEEEAELLREFIPAEKAHSVPNGVDLDYFQPATTTVTENSCVFVGALDYWPNVHGIVWFCENVWSEIIRKHADATLTIVGREPVAAVRELHSIPGVTVAGTVPDVRPYLADAAVAVVPLWIARGVQNKVLEAMAAGKPVLASPPPLVGLDIEQGVHLLQADSVPEWVSSLDQLFRDSALRQDLACAARLYVESRHCWDTCLEPFAQLLKRDAHGDSATQTSVVDSVQ